MSEVHRYKVVKMLSEVGNRISYDPHGPEVVMADAYDAVRALAARGCTTYYNGPSKADVRRLGELGDLFSTAR